MKAVLLCLLRSARRIASPGTPSIFLIMPFVGRLADRVSRFQEIITSSGASIAIGIATSSRVFSARRIRRIVRIFSNVRSVDQALFARRTTVRTCLCRTSLTNCNAGLIINRIAKVITRHATKEVQAGRQLTTSIRYLMRYPFSAI